MKDLWGQKSGLGTLTIVTFCRPRVITAFIFIVININNFATFDIEYIQDETYVKLPLSFSFFAIIFYSFEAGTAQANPSFKWQKKAPISF